MIIVTIEYFKDMFPKLDYGIANNQIKDTLIQSFIDSCTEQLEFYIKSSGYAIIEETPLFNLQLYICYKVASVLIPQYIGVDSPYLVNIETKWQQYHALGMQDLAKIIEGKTNTAFTSSIPRELLIP
tara:strand:+ start:537 stop:917 length:381 start_codon:yes stop_codon:yes gene_type:complete